MLEWNECETTGQQWALGNKSQTYWVDDRIAMWVKPEEYEPITLAVVQSEDDAKLVCETHSQLL